MKVYKNVDSLVTEDSEKQIPDGTVVVIGESKAISTECYNIAIMGDHSVARVFTDHETAVKIANLIEFSIDQFKKI